MAQLGMVGEWRHGLCNCFDDIGICIIAYFVPCVTFGQNAEAIGEGSCLLCGIAYLVPILNIIEWLNIRGKIRESNGIDGTTLGDCCTILWCPLCALTQEAMEIKESPNFSPILRS